ncbi:MAG: hypothetical protein Q9165_001574 [Trypethelium subeluteriae]
MADTEEKEKAEKLAAAKKRFEQLKKQQKGKKGGAASRKKEDKPETEIESTPAASEAQEDIKTADGEATGEAQNSHDNEAADQVTAEPTTPTVDRQHSETAKSRLRSASFRHGSSSGAVTAAGNGSVDAESEVQDIYRKQAQRIEELEKENIRLQDEAKNAAKKISERQEELEELREGSGEARMLKDRAEELGKLKAEVTSLQRQNTQLQSLVSKNRRISTASPSQASDLEAQIASKTSTIESLELDLSSIRSQLATAQESVNTRDAELAEIRSALDSTKSQAAEAQQQISDLQTQLEANAKDSSESSSLSKEAEARIALLTSQLSTAQRDATASTSRTTALEKKVDTLTTLHKEASARHQSRIDALATENAKLKRDAPARPTHPASASSPKFFGEEDDDDTALDALESDSRARLEQKVRALEAENSDLRRGVWRERRAELQPGIDTGDAATTTNRSHHQQQLQQQQQQQQQQHGSSSFDDVDLGSAGGFLGSSGSGVGLRGGRGAAPSPYRGTSTFSEVLSSGLSAFTGAAVASPAARRRGESMNAGAMLGQGMGRRESAAGTGDEGFLEDDDDFGFDEGAFARAQEEEARKRIERVREVKRGLEGWRGWRVDLVDLRGGIAAGVFDA